MWRRELTISTTKKLLGLTAAAGLLVALAGCGAAPETTPTSGAPEVDADFKPCIVSDDGGWNDKSFNQSAKAGIERAASELGVEPGEVESGSANDYAPNLENLVAEGCTLIVSVGFKLSADTVASALANPDINYAIIDDRADNTGAKDDDGNDIGDGTTDAPNIKPLLFDTVQAAYLGGYASAAWSAASGVNMIGTFGGIPIPPVTIFMDGFVDGVNYYNTVKGKNVKALGWDVAKQDGAFTGGFDANDTAKSTAQNLLDQGADVILPVGGPIYKSAAQAIKDSGKDIALIGVDADVTKTDPSIADILLTSIMKGIAVGVSDVVKSSADGKFDNKPFVGTLENGGVSIAPFHSFESKVDAGLQAELDALKADIISGKVKVESPSSPK
jgi:basic membrane protein A